MTNNIYPISYNFIENLQKFLWWRLQICDYQKRIKIEQTFFNLKEWSCGSSRLTRSRITNNDFG
jgi:hypothetical protein